MAVDQGSQRTRLPRWMKAVSAQGTPGQPEQGQSMNGKRHWFSMISGPLRQFFGSKATVSEIGCVARINGRTLHGGCPAPPRRGRPAAAHRVLRDLAAKESGARGRAPSRHGGASVAAAGRFGASRAPGRARARRRRARARRRRRLRRRRVGDVEGRFGNSHDDEGARARRGARTRARSTSSTPRRARRARARATRSTAATPT